MKEPTVRGTSLPDVSDAGLNWAELGSDRDMDALFEGVTWRRVVAFCIDFAILGLIFTALGFLIVASLGLFSPLWALSPLIPVAYHSWMISSSRSATCGMMIMRLEVRNAAGAWPTLLQAFAMTALFYLSVAVLTPLILIVALFSDRSRCVHDILSGTYVVQAQTDL